MRNDGPPVEEPRSTRQGRSLPCRASVRATRRIGLRPDPLEVAVLHDAHRDGSLGIAVAILVTSELADDSFVSGSGEQLVF
jgi:hypothetical protein